MNLNKAICLTNPVAVGFVRAVKPAFEDVDVGNFLAFCPT